MNEPPPSTPPPPRFHPVGWIVRGLGIGVLALFVALLAYGVMAQNPNTSIDASLGRGQTIAAPAFRLAVLQTGALGPRLERRVGATLRRPVITLSDLRGTPVVLNFYASWCVTCQAEAATLEQAWRQQARPRGVLLLGLDMQDVTSDAHAYMRHNGIDYPNVRDPTGEIARRYGVTGVPETFFIDARGQVVAHIIGVSSSSQLAAGIAAALAGSVGGAHHGGAQRSLK